MYHFIVNPKSGAGHGKKVWKLVKARLEEKNIPYKSYVLSGPGEATALSAAISRSNQPATIVVLGGDGTIDEVIGGLCRWDHITFACIPTGSGNDFVRGLHLERDPLIALDHILAPTKKLPINLGRISYTKPDRPSEVIWHSFIVSSGIGFDAAVCESVEASKWKAILNQIRLGKLVYLFTALWHLSTMKRHTLTVTTDDGKEQVFPASYFAAAMNLPYEGGGFQFCPDARPDDDHLDLFVAQGISRLRVLCLLPLAFPGKHVGFRGLHILHCKKATIQCSNPLCLHSNGEVIGYTSSLTYDLHEQKLDVILS